MRSWSSFSRWGWSYLLTRSDAKAPKSRPPTMADNRLTLVMQQNKYINEAGQKLQGTSTASVLCLKSSWRRSPPATAQSALSNLGSTSAITTAVRVTIRPIRARGRRSSLTSAPVLGTDLLMSANVLRQDLSSCWRCATWCETLSC